MENKSLIQGIKAIIIVFALSFSTNTYASTLLTGGSWWSNWWGGRNTHTHSRSCGHYGSGSGDSHSHYRGCGHSGTSGGGDTIPIDGGLGILLVGAALFGVKKLRDNRNEKI